MEQYNEFAAELAAEMTEENIVSECAICNGDGFVLVKDEFGETVAECSCLKKFHQYF